VSSGTAALTLVFGSLDFVILPAYSCLSILCAAQTAQVSYRFARRTNAASWCSAAREFETTSDLLVHTHGVVDPSMIRPNTIEDATMSLGAVVPMAKQGRTCVSSFYATKMICCGEGGVILSNDWYEDERYRQRRDCREPRWSNQANYKMTDVEAALGLSQLQRLDSFLSARAEIAKIYNEAIQNRGLLLPPQERFPNSVYGRYVILVPDRDRVRIEMMARGIECGVGIEKPLNFDCRSSRDMDSVTDQLCESSISLPIYPDLGEKKAKRVITALLEVLQ